MARRGTVAAVWLAVCGIAAAQGPDGGKGPDGGRGPAPASASIREQDLRADVSFLASELLEGRLTGSAGNRLAAEFVRARFEGLELVPVAGGSYFQTFRLMRAALGDGNTFAAHVGDATLTGRASEDFYPQPFSPSTRAEGPVVFAGFGIFAPERGHDDYRDVDLRGRVVLVLDHGPGERDPDDPRATLLTSDVVTPIRKALAAQEKGAAAILFAGDVQNHGVGAFAGEAARAWPSIPSRIDRYELASRAEALRIPAVRISPRLAEGLVSSLGPSLRAVAEEAERAAARRPVPLVGVRVEVSASVVRSLLPDRNVVAAIEGGDPRLREEWVIIGAHLDHDGVEGTNVFAGADDNASGVAGLLEIAEAYALAVEQERRPRRSVLFAAWNAEERGLLGAWAYADRPLVPLARTVAVLNLDMIGRSEDVPADGGIRFRGLPPQTADSNANAVNLLGYSYSSDLSDIVTRANAVVGLELKRRYDDNPSNLIRRSDQWPFLDSGVPAVWFFTGLHPDYHTFGDVPEKLDYSKMARVVRLVHQTSWLLAQEDARPALDRRPEP